MDSTTKIVSYARTFDYKVEGGTALALYLQGKSVTEIKAELNTQASTCTVWRAIQRAQGIHKR